MAASGDYLEASILASLEQSSPNKDDMREARLLQQQDDDGDSTGSNDYGVAAERDADEGVEDLCTQSQRSYAGSRMGGAGGSRTGPKAVLRDYRLHQQLEWERKQLERRQLIGHIQSKSMALRGPVDTTWTSSLTADPDPSGLSDTDPMLLLDAAEEAAAMESYRQSRLREMVDERARSGRSRPRFGQVLSVVAAAFPDAVDREDPTVTILVHLYDTAVEACWTLDRVWNRLAQRYGYVKFIQLRALEADPTFDTYCLPTVLAYRNGSVVVNLTRFMDAYHQQVAENPSLIRAMNGEDDGDCEGSGVEGDKRDRVSDLLQLEHVEATLLRHGALRAEDRCRVDPRQHGIRFVSKRPSDARSRVLNGMPQAFQL